MTHWPRLCTQGAVAFRLMLRQSESVACSSPAPSPSYALWASPVSDCLRRRAPGTPPVRSWLPPHHRDRRETVEGRPLDHPRAIRQIHERPTRQINQAHDLRLLEEERRPLAQHFGLFRQRRELHGDRPDLSTRDGKAGKNPPPRRMSLSPHRYARGRDSTSPQAPAGRRRHSHRSYRSRRAGGTSSRHSQWVLYP